MKKLLYISFWTIALGLSFNNLKAQDYTNIASGNWNSNLLVWGILTAVPGAGDDVEISTGTNVTISQNQSCQNLTIIGTLTINGGNLSASGNLILESGATINIISGNITVGGSFNYIGTLTITNATNNYIEITGDILNDTTTRWVTADGRVRIMSGMVVNTNQI